MPDGTATAHLFRPKLVTALSEGYSLSSFRKDVLAAVTVAIVALPLSMAIAVASGVSPERGLYTAIIGGFLVSALGGSRYQIGGPAGAFIVLVAATTTKFGLNGLLVTVMLSGAMLTLIGLSRLGSLIRHIPHPVTVGFTCGIAVTIFSGEIRDLFGLHLAGAEPGPLLPKLLALAKAAATVTPAGAGRKKTLRTRVAGCRPVRLLRHSGLEDGRRLIFNDPRRFGFMLLEPSESLPEHATFAGIGVEPLGNAFSAAHLMKMLAGRRTPMKAALLDQRNVAGLGNIYVCEALHRAGIAPGRPAASLTASEAERLVVIIRDVLGEAIEAGGSTLRDFRHEDGALGYFQHRFRVYDREGEPCPTPGCAGTIGRIVQSGRSTFHCETCQK